MIKLLRAEYLSQRIFLAVIFILTIAVPSLVFYVEAENTSGFEVVMPAVLFVMGIAALIVNMGFLVTNAISGKSRLFASLTVPLHKIALARFMFGYSFWLLLCIVFWLFFGLVIRPVSFTTAHEGFSSSALLDMIALNGFILSINVAYFISHDLQHMFQSIIPLFKMPLGKALSVMLNSAIFAVIIALVIMNQQRPLRSDVFMKAVSPAGCFFLNAAGFGLAGLSIITFIRRRSYLS